jgi:hypothetical protein
LADRRFTRLDGRFEIVLVKLVAATEIRVFPDQRSRIHSSAIVLAPGRTV